MSETKDMLHKATTYMEQVEVLQLWITQTLDLIDCYDDKTDSADEQVVKEKLAKIQVSGFTQDW